MERQSATLFENCPFEEGSKIFPTQSNIQEQVASVPESKAETNSEIQLLPGKTMEESYISIQDQLNQLINGFDYFSVGFKYAEDMYSQTTLTIHQEKAKCKKAVQDNTFLKKGLQQLMNVVFGDKPGIYSKNEILTGYAKRWQHFSGYMPGLKAACKQAVITGDGYLRKIKGDKGSYKYINIENSEDIYIDWNYDENRPNRYIERVYYTEARAKNIKTPQYKTFTLNTPLGTETINGIEYSADEIIHIKFDENIWGIYGRGAPACALDDIDILNQMERSAAIIAKYKAVPRKLLFPDTNKEEEVMNDKALMKVKKVLTNLRDYESPMVGTKFSALNLTDGGQALDLTPYFDYFKRKISIVLSPEFIVHGELVNRSTGVEQKQMFYLDVCAIRSDFEGVIEESTNEGLTSSLKVLEGKGVTVPKAAFYFEFGEYDVELRTDKTERLQKEWNDGMIRLNEYREEMGYEIDEEFGIAYKWELTTSPESQVAEGLKRITEENKNEKLR